MLIQNSGDLQPSRYQRGIINYKTGVRTRGHDEIKGEMGSGKRERKADYQKKKKKDYWSGKIESEFCCFPHSYLALWFPALSDLYFCSWIPLVGDTYLTWLASTYFHFCLPNIITFLVEQFFHLSQSYYDSIKVPPPVPIPSNLLIKMEKKNSLFSIKILLVHLIPFPLPS